MLLGENDFVILDTPEFATNNRFVTIDVYRSGTLKCTAKGHPKMEFHWIRDGKRLLPNNSYENINVSATTYSLHRDEGSSTLTITVNDKDDFGNHTCICTN